MNIWISQAYNWEYLGKQKDQDEIEEQENLEVGHDSIQHGNNIAHGVENPQEEESLVDLHQEDYRHHELALEGLRIEGVL